jgi:ribosomal protein L11 methyltransferase
MLILTAIGPLALIRTCADAFDRLDPSPAEAVSWFEEDVGRFRLEVYAATEEHVDVCLALLGAEAPDLHVNVAPVEDANWVAMALDGLPPVRAGRFVVAGAHALARAPQGATRIWIEASEAFGTGHHGTTMGCLLALDGMVKRGRRPRRVLDVGAGSGVLAIAAAKVGAKALGVEIDARAAEIARENIKNNKVAASVRMLTADGVRVARAKPGHYDLVFANILMRPLIRMAPALIGALAPGGRIVLSGLLVGQVPLVRAAYENRGLTMAARRRRHGWATLTFIKP